MGLDRFDGIFSDYMTNLTLYGPSDVDIMLTVVIGICICLILSVLPNTK